MKFHPLGHHLLDVMANSWIHLAGNISVFEAGGFENGQIDFCPPFDDLFVSLPENHLCIDAPVLRDKVIHPLIPVVRIILDRIVR